MSIQTADLINEIEGLLDDEKQENWETADIRKALNQGVRTAFSWVVSADEYLFLEKDTVTVDATAVTNGTLIFTLPARTTYVSHWCNKKYTDAVKGFDFRPLWVPGSGDSSRLIPFTNYMIGLPNIIFNEAFTATGTVELWVKKFPARIKENDATLALPEAMYDLILELSLFYAHRKDANPEEESGLILHRDQTLTLLKHQIGFPEAIKVDWDDLYDSGDF